MTHLTFMFICELIADEKDPVLRAALEHYALQLGQKEAKDETANRNQKGRGPGAG